MPPQPPPAPSSAAETATPPVPDPYAFHCAYARFYSAKLAAPDTTGFYFVLIFDHARLQRSAEGGAGRRVAGADGSGWAVNVPICRVAAQLFIHISRASSKPRRDGQTRESFGCWRPADWAEQPPPPNTADAALAPAPADPTASVEAARLRAGLG